MQLKAYDQQHKPCILEQRTAYMFRIITTYIFIILSLAAAAQGVDTFTISGVVVSALSNKPIPGATIMYSKRKGTTTDEQGRFTISELSRGTHQLKISTLGYSTKDTTVLIDNADIKEMVWRILTTCAGHNTRDGALRDIRKGRAMLLVQGGEAPVLYTKDKDFLQKYKIGYDVFGCVAPADEEYLKLYNQTIFEYLDRTFGKAWQKDVRKDVIGFKDK
jgi:hypothetical protein